MFLVIDTGVTPAIVVNANPIDEQAAHELAEKYIKVHARQDTEVFVTPFKPVKRTAERSTK